MVQWCSGATVAGGEIGGKMGAEGHGAKHPSVIEKVAARWMGVRGGACKNTAKILQKYYKNTMHYKNITKTLRKRCESATKILQKYNYKKKAHKKTALPLPT